MATAIKNFYVHIPFCSQLCHYCDFAKTSLYSKDWLDKYFADLNTYLKLSMQNGYIKQLDTIFFGGGTPSLFTNEYEALFETLAPFISSKTEVTLESNPNDITSEKLKLWKSYGFNRISIGIQTQDPKGLKFLTRTHSPQVSTTAVEKALEEFENVNIDLIYGWKGQTLNSWQEDLKFASQVPHISCYSLTFEPGTVLGRRVARNILQPTPDQNYEKFYSEAKKILRSFNHEEISNWSRDGFSCRHNWAYWNGSYFLALGCGAHGYLQHQNYGIRYSFPKNLKKYLELNPEDFFHSVLKIENEHLDRESWVVEQVATGFRTSKGINVNSISQHSKIPFQKNKALIEALESGQIIESGDFIRLSQDEWIRENYWCGVLIDSFNL